MTKLAIRAPLTVPQPRALGIIASKGLPTMPLMMAFTALERVRLRILINNLCVYAAQLMLQTSPEFSRRDLANLAMAKTEDEPLLKRLDELARELGDESPLRVIEDIPACRAM